MRDTVAPDSVGKFRRRHACNCLTFSHLLGNTTVFHHIGERDEATQQSLLVGKGRSLQHSNTTSENEHTTLKREPRDLFAR